MVRIPSEPESESRPALPGATASAPAARKESSTEWQLLGGPGADDSESKTGTAIRSMSRESSAPRNLLGGLRPGGRALTRNLLTGTFIIM
jgi:hypothetical protein